VDELFALAARCRDGIGIGTNVSMANDWFARASAKELASYRKGFKLSTSPAAIEWYKCVANGGNSDGMFMLAMHYEGGFGVARDLATAALWCERASEENENAALWLVKYYKGTSNRAKMFEWVCWAAKNGDDVARFDRATCYLNGDGVEKDAGKAVVLYGELIEDLSDESIGSQELRSEAAFQLGRCYWNGNGVGKNRRKAFEWYSRALPTHELATYAVLHCFFANICTEAEARGALQNCRELADVDRKDAMYCLALWYKNENDMNIAQEWLQKAADYDHNIAKFILTQRNQDETIEARLAVISDNAISYESLADCQRDLGCDGTAVLVALNLLPKTGSYDGPTAVDAQQIIRQADIAHKRRLLAYDIAAVDQLVAAFLACDVSVDSEVARLVSNSLKRAGDMAVKMHAAVQLIDVLELAAARTPVNTVECYFSRLTCNNSDYVVLVGECRGDRRSLPCRRTLMPLVLALHTLTHIVELNRELNVMFGTDFFIPTVKAANELRKRVLAALDTVDRSTITIASL
jgi:TPR repeat protein